MSINRERRECCIISVGMPRCVPNKYHGRLGIKFPSLLSNWRILNKASHTMYAARPLRTFFHPSQQEYRQTSNISRTLVGNKIDDKQRVLMHGHPGWNVRHGLCHIYMRYVYIYELFIAFVIHPPNEVGGGGGGGGGGILDSPCPSVCPSVRLSVDDMVSGA